MLQVLRSWKKLQNNRPYSSKVLINAHSRPGGKMADFSKSEAGAYFIALCYKYAVATCMFLFLLFLSLLSFNSFHCCFHLKFYITFLHCVRVTTLPLVRRRIFFNGHSRCPSSAATLASSLNCTALYTFHV